MIYTRTPESRVFTDPAAEDKANFFIFGLAGEEKHFYAKNICLEKKLDQVVLDYTGEDVLTAIFTFGLYTPRTVKFWCSI